MEPMTTENFYKFKNVLLDAIEANSHLEPKQIFGQMIQLAVCGLYDTAPNLPTAQAVINISLQNGLDDHMEEFINESVN